MDCLVTAFYDAWNHDNMVACLSIWKEMDIPAKSNLTLNMSFTMLQMSED